MVDKHHILDGDAIRISRQTGTSSGAMEDHDSQPAQRRRHLLMMMFSFHVGLLFTSVINSVRNLILFNTRDVPIVQAIGITIAQFMIKA